ncbi:hypothetical protein LO762_17335 [Actinocorallia sp. API 0066]|uniref:hypothetical protein n=1 Tax=Actinocorallia sp. API 0066 TaxID=2896846 RepID=UPI001E3AE705|nr:hypothetical protein [Actinocorallia sp. API 0066]MCD0450944.1 hypothetical protein [Actinocorallia sp. API 0066]
MSMRAGPASRDPNFRGIDVPALSQLIRQLERAADDINAWLTANPPPLGVAADAYRDARAVQQWVADQLGMLTRRRNTAQSQWDNPDIAVETPNAPDPDIPTVTPTAPGDGPQDVTPPPTAPDLAAGDPDTGGTPTDVGGGTAAPGSGTGTTDDAPATPTGGDTPTTDGDQPPQTHGSGGSPTSPAQNPSAPPEQPAEPPAPAPGDHGSGDHGSGHNGEQPPASHNGGPGGHSGTPGEHQPGHDGSAHDPSHHSGSGDQHHNGQDPHAHDPSHSGADHGDHPHDSGTQDPGAHDGSTGDHPHDGSAQDPAAQDGGTQEPGAHDSGTGGQQEPGAQPQDGAGAPDPADGAGPGGGAADAPGGVAGGVTDAYATIEALESGDVAAQTWERLEANADDGDYTAAFYERLGSEGTAQLIDAAGGDQAKLDAIAESLSTADAQLDFDAAWVADVRAEAVALGAGDDAARVLGATPMGSASGTRLTTAGAGAQAD